MPSCRSKAAAGVGAASNIHVSVAATVAPSAWAMGTTEAAWADPEARFQLPVCSAGTSRRLV